jgi:hypothetical protein
VGITVGLTMMSEVLPARNFFGVLQIRENIEATSVDDCDVAARVDCFSVLESCCSESLGNKVESTRRRIWVVLSFLKKRNLSRFTSREDHGCVFVCGVDWNCSSESRIVFRSRTDVVCSGLVIAMREFLEIVDADGVVDEDNVSSNGTGQEDTNTMGSTIGDVRASGYTGACSRYVRCVAHTL